MRFTAPGYTLDEQASLDDPTKEGCVHKALSLAREDVERSGSLVPSAPRGARPQGRRHPLRRTEPPGLGARSLPLLRPRTPTRSLWQLLEDDRELIGLKITLLAGLGVLTAALEWVR